MKKTTFVAFLTVLSLVLEVCHAQHSGQRYLFTKDGDVWITGGEASWIFVEGNLVGNASAGDGFVMTKESYRFFELELEFHPDQQVNSGVFIRCAEESLSATACYEINIWDDHPNQAARTGAVVSRSEPLQIVRTIDQWNNYKIVSNQGGIKAWINDVKVVDLKDSSLSGGFIALQAANKGSIRFRNVRIQMLDN